VVENGPVSYLLFGKEVGETGTPHLQGLVSLIRKSRLSVVKNLLGSNPHLEVCRNLAASVIYCKKEGDFYEFGQLRGPGKRNDLDEFKKAVKAGMLSIDDVREVHSDVYSRYPRFCLEYMQQYRPQVVIPDHPLRPWQVALLRKLDEQPDRRKIIFVVDEKGNSGKSWFAHFYARQNPTHCQVILPGKKADMAYALKMNIRVLFCDAPRSKQGEFIQYDFLEDCKNGYVFSTKYESHVKSFEPMHVVVNMNESPDRSKLSEDRYDVINIRQL
jgi:Putative viral replication protein